jgi:hypothetical protein
MITMTVLGAKDRLSAFESFYLLCAIALAVLASFALIVAVVVFAPVHLHASYLISIAERIAGGDVPFKNFRVDYSPGVLYFLAFCYKFGGYSACLIASLGVVVVDGILLAGIVRGLTFNRTLSAVGGVGTVLVMFFWGGTYFLFDPFFLACWLLSFYILVHYPYHSLAIYSASIVAGLAFWMKQHGLVVSASFFCCVCLFRNSFQKTLYCVAGILIGLLLPLGILSSLTGFSPLSLLSELSGSEYRSLPVPLSDTALYLVQVLHGGVFSLWLIFVPAYRRLIVGLVWLPILFFLPALTIRTYEYYFQAFIPFGWLGLLLLYRYLSEVRPNYRPILSLSLTLALVFLSVGALKYAYFLTRDGLKQQQQVEISTFYSFWPRGSRVLFIPTTPYLYMGHYLPSDDFVPGYCSIDNFAWETVKSIIEHSSKIAILYEYVALPRQEIEQILYNGGFKAIGRVGAFELYEREVLQ